MGHKGVAMSHKRSRGSQTRRDVAWTRNARTKAAKEGTNSSWPVDRGTYNGTSRVWVQVTPRPTDHESAGHYHWRMRHKNLSKPVLQTGPVTTTME